MSDPKVLLERRGAIALLTLNRPDARNAIDLDVVNELAAHLSVLERDPSVLALVLTGAGGKAFAAGADIGQLRDRGRDDAFLGINSNLFRKLEDFPRPTIAAIAGYALGGGLELAMACDLRVCGASARFGQPEVGLGIMPAAGATYRLPRLVGIGKARELIFTGEIIDAPEAHRIGLVNRIVADEEVVAAALAMAGRIVDNDPLGVRVAKLNLAANSRGGSDASVALETLGQAILFESEAKRERMTAFLDRRGKKR